MKHAEKEYNLIMNLFEWCNSPQKKGSGWSAYHMDTKIKKITPLFKELGLINDLMETFGINKSLATYILSKMQVHRMRTPIFHTYNIPSLDSEMQHLIVEIKQEIKTLFPQKRMGLWSAPYGLDKKDGLE